MDLLDWGKRDLAAAINFMSRDDVPAFVIGHSYDGHALGLLSNHSTVSTSMVQALDGMAICLTSSRLKC